MALCGSLWAGVILQPAGEGLCGGLEFGVGFGVGEVEDWGELVAGVGRGVGGDLFGGADGYDLAAGAAALGAHVDDPVGGLDDVEVVLDDEEGAAAIDEFAEGGEEFRTSSKWRPVVGSSRM